MIKENLNLVRTNIKNALLRSRRREDDVRLICVTKEAESPQVLEAISCGVTDFGENRVKEAELKYRAIGDKVRWHLIGHLQTNKVKSALPLFSLIHSVDTIKLAERINKESQNIGKVQDIMVEINVSGESSKFGIEPKMLETFLGSLKNLSHVNVTGLMTVTPFTDNAERSRPYFRELKGLRDKYRLRELSMGMTQDYEVAVEEGSTMVRVGRAIFK